MPLKPSVSMTPFILETRNLSRRNMCVCCLMCLVSPKFVSEYDQRRIVRLDELSASCARLYAGSHVTTQTHNLSDALLICADAADGLSILARFVFNVRRLGYTKADNSRVLMRDPSCAGLYTLHKNHN